MADFGLDSIVRGTTSKEIVQMAKDVGAKNVIVASCAPPIRYALDRYFPNYALTKEIVT
jgi:glutamine phosphoribosylpyrophosphate amidotransferase